jgi:hypothetical protein
MVKRANAIRFDKVMSSGRCRPVLMACIDDAGDEVEMIVKFSAASDRGQTAMICEALAAMFARDLDLPVPEPYAVEITGDFVETLHQTEIYATAKKSIGPNFGSKKLPPGFSTFPAGQPLPRELEPIAAEVFAFDLWTCNPDRRPANPNCLRRGKEIAIIDHELAFSMDMILGWRSPWVTGVGVAYRRVAPEFQHLFRDALQGKSTDLSRISGAVEALTDSNLSAYRAALPQAWIGSGEWIDKALQYLKELTKNVNKAVTETLLALG